MASPGAGPLYRLAGAAVGGLAAAAGVVALRAASRRGQSPGRFVGAARRRARGIPIAAACALAGLAGMSMGLRSGAGALGACAAGVRENAPVFAAGTLQDAVPAQDSGAAPRLARVSLRDVRIVADGAPCRMRTMRAFVRRRASPVAAGSVVAARGVWRSSARSALPRPPRAAGWLGSGTIETFEAGAGKKARRDLNGYLVAWRAALLDRLGSRLSQKSGMLGKALLLADRSGLDPEVRESFVGAGIIHLLAISGLHVGFIGASLAWIIGLRVRGPRRILYAATLTSGYVALIGAPPSAVRAALMFWGWALASRRERPARLSDLAALAAMLATLADPLIITDPGFQLSYAGFAGVVCGGRAKLPASLRGRTAGLVRSLAVSSGAFIATAPIAAFHFDRIVVASIPASIVAGAIVALALPSLAATLLLPPGLWMAFAGAADALLLCLAAIASFFAGLPLGWSGPALGAGYWLIAAASGLLALDRTGFRRGVGIVALGATLAITSVWSSIQAAGNAGKSLVCTLDVGQGDAAVVRTGRGRWLVFDAGPGAGFLGAGPGSRPRTSGTGSRVVAPFLRDRGVRTVEIFAISHPHLDHFGGGAEVFDALRVRRVLDPGVPEPSASYLAFLERAEAEGASWHAPRAGDRFRLDDVEIEALWPDGSDELDANEGSFSFRLVVGDFSYVNTGDASVSVEQAILARRGPNLPKADLLKLGHHGSHTSTSLEWLRATEPAIAVISAGSGNSYGHPHASTLARLDSAEVERVWRTDLEGTLCIDVGPGGWRIADAP